MSDTATPAAPSGGRMNWLKAALVASLAVNLLFVGAVAARWYAGHGPERYARLTQTQLIPRQFFRDLDRDRRMELLSVFRASDRQVRDGRRAVKAQVLALADALEAEPYDAARARAAVAAFTARSEDLFATGSTSALTLLGMLTPEERKLMAQHLRARDERPRSGKDANGKDGS